GAVAGRGQRARLVCVFQSRRAPPALRSNHRLPGQLPGILPGRGYNLGRDAAALSVRETVGEMMESSYKQLTDFLLSVGAEAVEHSNKSYLAHLIGVYRDMKDAGCTEELCRAGMFHSIYGTELFQRFALPLERRAEVRALIGERAERLAYLNCVMDRATFD